MSQQFISFKILVIVFSPMSRAWEDGNKVTLETQLLDLQGTDRFSIVIVSYLSDNTFSSLISLVVFFYNWTSILLESDVSLGILVFSFLFSKIGYAWPNSLDSASPYNSLILENLKCEFKRLFLNVKVGEEGRHLVKWFRYYRLLGLPLRQKIFPGLWLQFLLLSPRAEWIWEC